MSESLSEQVQRLIDASQKYMREVHASGGDIFTGIILPGPPREVKPHGIDYHTGALK